MISDKEGIDRKAEDYVILARAGLFAQTFEGSYQLPPQPWEMTFCMLRDMDTDSAKRAALTFVENQYAAKNVSFWRVPSSKSKFVARFMRGDV